MLDGTQEQKKIRKPGRELIDQRRIDGVTYRLERIKCGKRRCKCAGGTGHGPYWYSYQWINGRVKSRYLGKALPTGDRGD